MREGLELSTAAAKYISEVYGVGRFLEDLRLDFEGRELAKVLGTWKLVGIKCHLNHSSDSIAGHVTAQNTKYGT